MTKSSNISVNIGQMIKEHIMSRNDVSIRGIAELLGKSNSGFNDKLNTKHYGTTLDLIQISIILKHDFVSPLLSILVENDIPVDNFPNTPDNTEAIKNYKTVKEDAILWKAVVKKNFLK